MKPQGSTIVRRRKRAIAAVWVILPLSVVSCQPHQAPEGGQSARREDGMMDVGVIKAERLAAAIKAAGFNVEDSDVKWGATVVVDAEHTSGGFAADVEEGAIRLRWNGLPGATAYEVFRSTQPLIPLFSGTLVAMDSLRASPQGVVELQDIKVDSKTRYFYAVLAISGGGLSTLVATGSAALKLGEEATATTTAADGGNLELLEREERRAIREQHGVQPLGTGMEASNAPAGTYGSTWGVESDGSFLIYGADDRDKPNHPFEIHKSF